MLRFPQLYKITQNAEGFNTKVSDVIKTALTYERHSPASLAALFEL